jgi:flagellar biosynthesis chaperone FliJ
MTRPDLDAIRAKWKQRNVVSGNDVPTLLRHIDTLEHMLAEERENVDTLRAAVEHAEQRFVDEYDARKAAEREIAELKARITVLEAMR